MAVLAVFSTASALAAGGGNGGGGGGNPPPPVSLGTFYDLSPAGDQHYSVDGEVGGEAIFSDFFMQPTGTGVFKPFLDLKSPANGKVEGAYNTDSATTYLDGHRAPWNRSIKFGELADIMIDGTKYYGFVLDANEPGPSGTKSLISVDNVRVYTSSADNTGLVKNDITKLDNLGVLRWALNNPTLNGNPTVTDGYNIDPWVKLDAAQDNLGAGSNHANGGSGMGDMIVYIKASDFGDAKLDDYVWLYNLNGVHYSADADLAATSGFEEWRAITGLHVPPPTTRGIPDGGLTIGMLGAGLLGLGAIRRKAN